MAVVETAVVHAAAAVFRKTHEKLKEFIPGGWYTIIAGLLVILLMTIGTGVAFVTGYVGGAMGGDAKNSVICEDGSGTAAAGSGNQPASAFGGDHQKRNAQGIIDAVAKKGMSERAAIIAIATAMQESTLRMYWNPKVPGSKALTDEPDAQGVDGYSVGLFQQQVNGSMFAWGTVEDAMNIEKSTFMFLDALQKVPGWESLPLTVAAQRVQGSAHPDLYADDEPAARAMVKAMPPSSGKFGSGGSSGATKIDSKDAVVASGAKTTKDIYDPKATSSTGLKVPTDSVYTKDAKRAWSATIQFWGDRLDTIGGYRSGANALDHGTGQAIDVMIPNYKSKDGIALGDDIAAHFVDNYKGYGVNYVIWRNRMWLPPGASNSGWGPYNGGNVYSQSELNDTTLHNDHVHISVAGNAGDGIVSKDGSSPNGGATEACELGSGTGTSGVGVAGGKGDDYPFKTKPTWLQAGAGPQVADPWGGYYRECVSFVYWRINQQLGADPLKPNPPFSKAKYPGLGNGADFGPGAAAGGFKVDQKPAPGAIAWWTGGRGIATSSAGHVAIVLKVNNNGTVLVEHYNASPPHAYSTMTISANEPSGYIHVADTK